jgi:hypothetical protein
MRIIIYVVSFVRSFAAYLWVFGADILIDVCVLGDIQDYALLAELTGECMMVRAREGGDTSFIRYFPLESIEVNLCSLAVCCRLSVTITL